MNKLKELRQAAGLSTRKLSEALGGRISHSEIVQLENGGRKFSEWHIKMFCDFFHVDASILLGMRVEKVEIFTEQDIAFLRAYNAMSLEDKKELTNYLEFMNFKKKNKA
jgi:transcriptional regulator with XRE-family HTH domain